MPPHSYLEWIAGANIPRPRTARPKRRIFAEYETDDEDEEVEFLVRSNKKSPKKGKAKNKDKDKDDEQAPAAKEPSLKSALKKVAAAASDVSDSALSSDKEVETSGSEAETTSASTSASASAVEERSRDFDPECPCRHCLKSHKALKRSRLGKKAKRVSFSDDEDDTDASDDAETVHNFFKWNQAMEAKKTRDQDAKDYKEYLVDKAKKEEAAKKEAEKKREDDLREKIKKEEESKKKNEQEKGKAKQGKSKDNKADSSSKETAETSTSEAEISKDGKDAESSDADSQKGGKSTAKVKDQRPSKASPPPPDAADSDNEETAAMRLLMEQLLRKQEKDKSKKKSKHKSREKEKPDQEIAFSHPAGSYDPNWLMPPRSSVVHVEHSMEAPTDPRPNAFYDNRNGVMRVYHGSNYGNPTGALYQTQAHGPGASPHTVPHFNNNNNNNNNNKDFNTYGSQFPPQPYGPYSGHPPPHPTQSMSQIPQSNANHWFQGSGTTVVPGTPVGGQQNSGFVKSSGFPHESHRFTDLTDRFENSSYNTHRPNTNSANHQMNFKAVPPTQSPGFDPAYFSSTVGMNSNPLNNTDPGWGVQNAQSVNRSSMPSSSGQDALIAKDLAELKARQGGFIGGSQNGQPPGSQSTPPAARTSPSKSNGAEAFNANGHNSWDNAASADPTCAANDNWTTSTNTNNGDASSWGNSGNNDTSGWNSTTTSHNNNSTVQTSPAWGQDSNNNNNDTTNPSQNVSNWSSQPSVPAQDSMPGAYPSPSLTSPVKNDFGSADWNASQDTNTAGQGWGDPSAANTSGGFWDSGDADASKAPVATSQW